MPSSHVTTTPIPISPWSTAMLNKVPEATFVFWIIKIMATTVGETGADFLNVKLNFGLGGTSVVITALLAVTLFAQLRRAALRPVALLGAGGARQRSRHADYRQSDR